MNGTIAAHQAKQQDDYAKRIEAFGAAAAIAPYRITRRIPQQRPAHKAA